MGIAQWKGSQTVPKMGKLSLGEETLAPFVPRLRGREQRQRRHTCRKRATLDLLGAIGRLQDMTAEPNGKSRLREGGANDE